MYLCPGPGATFSKPGQKGSTLKDREEGMEYPGGAGDASSSEFGVGGFINILLEVGGKQISSSELGAALVLLVLRLNGVNKAVKV